MVIVPLSLVAWNVRLSCPACFVDPFVAVDTCCIFAAVYEEKKNSSCWNLFLVFLLSVFLECVRFLPYVMC